MLVVGLCPTFGFISGSGGGHPMNERFSHSRDRARARKKAGSNGSRFGDMLMELEQRIAFDAAAGEHAEAAAERHSPNVEKQPEHDFSALAKALEARGNAQENRSENIPSNASTHRRDDSSNGNVDRDRELGRRGASGITHEEHRGELGSRNSDHHLRASLDIPNVQESTIRSHDSGLRSFQDGNRPASDTAHRGNERHNVIADEQIGFLDGNHSTSSSAREIVFVAGDIEDKDSLIASFGKDVEVVTLDPTKDGVEQIAAALKGRTGIEAIHILSHGGEGQLSLGTASLTADSMQGEYLDELTVIGHALSADGDILIYGCDFTAGDAGLRAAIVLGGITGADIAASTDTTGHVDLGGDWDLETHVGAIEAAAIDPTDWHHALVQTTINPTGGTLGTGADGLRIYVGNTGQLQVTYKGLTQFYSPNVTDTSTSLFNGIFLAYGNRILGPSTSVTNIVDTVWQSAGAQTLTGAGTEANPYVVTTRLYYNIGGTSGYDAGTDLLVQIETIYASPNAFFTQNVTVTPPTANGQIIKYYHTLDTYLAGVDAGPAFSLDPSLAINNITDGDPSYVGVRRGIGTSTEAVVGFAEVEGSPLQFDHYYSAVYNGMYASMDNGGDLANTWNTNPSTDNGIAVQFTLGAITTAQTFSYRIAFDGDTTLDLDANNSTATGTSYVGTFQATTGSQVAVVDTDIDITNVIGGIADATVTLTNPQSGDVLTVDDSSLPAGITVTVHSAYSVTIAGVADAAAYEAALQTIKFSSTSGVTSTRSFTVAVHNQLNSVTTTATATLNGNFSPVVDLNSGLTGIVQTNNIVANGDFADYADKPYGWTEGGSGTATDSGVTGRYAFTSNNAATLTQDGLTGLNVGPGLNGAGQITLDIGWVNSATSSRTFEIQVAGVVYARLTTGAAVTSGAIAYLNGATNAAGTTATTAITAMGSGTGTLTSIIINLPAAVAASGSLVFSGSNAGDDVYIDNVRLRTNITSMVDQTAGSNWNATYTENGSPVAISDTDNDVRDGDSANMASGVVTITNAQSGDRLLVGGSAAASGTINGISYTNTGSVVTLTGSATKANYAAAIRAITFENTTDNPGSVTRDITVTVNDGTTNSSAAHAFITVVPVNDAPVDANETNSVIEDTTLSVAAPGVLANATDPDGDTMTVSQFVWNSVTYAAGATATVSGVGQLTINANGSYSFVPVANYTGAIPVATYTVSDGNGGTDTSTLTLTMTAVNDAPAGADKTITTNEDTAYTFAVADFGFSDPNDSPANAFQDVIITTLPASGTLLLNGVAVTAGQVITVAQIPTLTWTPPANGNGTAVSSFTFQVRDNGGTANGGQNTDQTPNTISFNVTSINDAPAGADKTITTNEDTAYTFAVADFGFSDPNDSPANAFQDVIIT
ncbi:DUF4347 domain-containing protein, partial [Mesorhizobium denitrificans]